MNESIQEKMQEENIENNVTFFLKNFKIELKIDTPDFENLFSPPDSIKAPQTFQDQTNEKKRWPLGRFWKSPESLVDKCAQHIAKRMMEQGYTYDRGHLPGKVNRVIDDLLKEANRGIKNQQLMNKIHKVIEEDSRQAEQIGDDIWK